MKNAIRAASALLVSAALVAIFILPVAADSFSIYAYSDYTISTISTTAPANYISLRNLSAGTIIEFSRSYPWPSHNAGSSVSDISDSNFYRFKINSNLSILNFYFASSATVIFRFYSSIVTSDDFSAGDVHPIVPISPSGSPGGYSVHLSTDNLNNELYFYSGHEITDFGGLNQYLSDSFTDTVYVGDADELYFDGSFTITPDKYAIFLTLTYHVYKFENVPVGTYTFNDSFTFSKSFDNSSYTVDQLIIPRFVVVDTTDSYADAAFDDIFDSFTSGQISSGQAISQIDNITGALISSSDDPNAKIYWRIVQDSYTNRINDYVDTSSQETMRAAFESSQDDMDNLIDQLYVEKPIVELPDLVDQGIDGSYIQQLFNPIYNNGFINAMMILAVSFGIIGYILYGRRA